MERMADYSGQLGQNLVPGVASLLFEACRFFFDQKQYWMGISCTFQQTNVDCSPTATDIDKSSLFGGLTDGEENILEAEEDLNLQIGQAKILTALAKPISLAPMERYQASLSLSNMSIQSRKNSILETWAEIMSRKALEEKSQKEKRKRGVSDYQSYLMSYMPQFKNIVISEQKFFKIREEPINQYYSMSRKLGEGAFGSVYEAECKKTGDKRAVKMMKVNLMSVEDMEIFKNEVNILRQMDHINIIKIYDIFTFQNFFYVVTEYCAGGTLAEAFHKGKLKDKKIIQSIMKQIFSALYYMHHRSIVHRDMKLENLVLVEPISLPSPNSLSSPNSLPSPNVCIKIIDFGLAVKAESTGANPCGLVGTPSYIAPEIIKGHYWFSSDVWSCGIILLLLLAGSNPFKKKKHNDTFNAILNRRINFEEEEEYAGLSSDEKNLLNRMLCKFPNKRISSQSCLGHPFIKKALERKVEMSAQQDILVVKHLTNYERGSNFTCFIKNFLISKKATQNERQEMAKIFEMIDTDASGVIDRDELMNLYSVVTGLSSEDIEKQLSKIDQNNSDKIDFHEFMLVMCDNEIMHNQSYLQEAFDFFDQDRTGFIEKPELLECLAGCEEEEIVSIIRNIDSNGDGKISKSEFLKFMMELDTQS